MDGQGTAPAMAAQTPIRYIQVAKTCGKVRALADQIDRWRREQPDLPNRAEAARRLIELGLAATVVHAPADPTVTAAPKGREKPGDGA